LGAFVTTVTYRRQIIYIQGLFKLGFGDVAGALCYKPEVACSKPNEVKFSIYLILLAAVGSGVYSASNTN
jgi:hypothetical protein